MSSLDDIVTIVEFHRRRWKPPASLTISLTKSLRVAGSLHRRRSGCTYVRNWLLVLPALLQCLSDVLQAANYLNV